jgi:arylformamidase
LRQVAQSPWLATVALDSAAMDVETITRRQHFRFYDQAFKQEPAYWRQASPIHRLVRVIGPFLTTKDKASCARSNALAPILLTLPTHHAVIAKTANAVGMESSIMA